MAVKIVRRPNQIVLLGAPTSAASLFSGHEQAPRALRDAGLVDRLRSIGYEVFDHGDDPIQLSAPDTESPRARNISAVLKSLEALKPRVESAVKSGALPLILGGDCSVVLAVVAGLRRYFRSPGLIYMDRDADLNVPATTPSGCVDGMVVSHLVGRGAAELVRFWGEPPLVREPDLVLFGVDRLDPPEEQFLARSPLRRYLASDILRQGPVAVAKEAVGRLHGGHNEFVLHFDVDVIADFPATNYPGTRGLSLSQIREALEVFMTQEFLAAVEVTAYNPQKDADASGANTILDLLVHAFALRAESLRTSAAAGDSLAAGVSAVSVSPAASLTESKPDSHLEHEAEQQKPAVTAGENWSPDGGDKRLQGPETASGTSTAEETEKDPS